MGREVPPAHHCEALAASLQDNSTNLPRRYYQASNTDCGIPIFVNVVQIFNVKFVQVIIPMTDLTS